MHENSEANYLLWLCIHRRHKSDRENASESQNASRKKNNQRVSCGSQRIGLARISLRGSLCSRLRLAKLGVNGTVQTTGHLLCEIVSDWQQIHGKKTIRHRKE